MLTMRTRELARDRDSGRVREKVDINLNFIFRPCDSLLAAAMLLLLLLLMVIAVV